MQQRFTAINNYKSRTDAERSENVNRIMERIINSGSAQKMPKPPKKT